MTTATLLVATALACGGGAWASLGGPSPGEAWPEGTERLSFENLEGLILITVSARGVDGRDTTGLVALDTGAGFLALDRALAVSFGLVDSAAGPEPIGVADRPLPRLAMGSLTMDLVSPVLTFRAEGVRRATDRPVLGLLGQKPLRDRAVWIDYRAESLAFIPAGLDTITDRERATAASRRLLGGLIGPDAVPVAFRLAGDGKALVQARVVPAGGASRTPWLTLVLDTGASKCFLFEEAVSSLTRLEAWRPWLRGMQAPTLFGTSAARLTRVRRVELRSPAPGARAADVDIALLRSPLAAQLERVAGEPVHGLLGYSFLKRFRVVCDYPHRVLWLDPIPGYRDDRPFEHSHVGLQIERYRDGIRIAAVAAGSPAAAAGILPGDELVEVNGSRVAAMDAIEIARLMEGKPGTSITITIRRDEIERTHRLRRRRLL